MKRYIKINSDNYIIDIFGEHLKDRFDGTEIEFDESESPADVWINNKCIFDEIGNPIFQYVKGKAIENPDNEAVNQYKTKIENEKKISEARQYLLDTDYKIIKEFEVGELCPAEVKAKREECRKIINDLQGA
jgi:hypothetical protein